MIEAPKGEDEKRRMAALKRLKILETPLEERFERITRIVCKSMDVPISAVSLVDEDRQWFKSIQGINAPETPRSVAFCAHAILDDQALVVEDALEDERFHDNPLVTDDPSIRFYAGVPIEIEDNIRIGTLCAIDRKPREAKQEELDLLRDLADMVRAELTTIALSEAHAELIDDLKEAERAALIDPLTRLWNRGGGEKLLEREWAAAERKEEKLHIALLDIDHFKEVNDIYGHDVGDEVIRSVAQTTIASLRSSDIVARWGGEEFLIIMPHCNPDDFEPALARVLKDIETNPLLTNDGIVKISASIGGFVVEDPKNISIKDALCQADKKLYQAKDNGRNQFMMG